MGRPLAQLERRIPGQRMLCMFTCLATFDRCECRTVGDIVCYYIAVYRDSEA